jgi:hypothetical protein
MNLSTHNLFPKLNITRKFRIYCRLVRLPNIFTSVSDVLAGYILASPGLIDIHNLIPLTIASACLYGGGIVFNDYFDYSADKTERPNRPLPSAKVSQREALCLGIILFMIALFSTFLVNLISLCVSIIIIFLVMSYNAGTKNVSVIGTFNMGLCRFLNMILGLSIIPATVSSNWIFPLILMIYVMLITALSKLEVKGDGKVKIVLVSVCFLVLVFLAGSLPIKGSLPNTTSLGLLFIFTLVVLWPMGKAIIKPCPENIQGTIKTMVLSIIILDAYFVMGATNGLYALVVLALLIPAFTISRFLYVT